MHYRNPSVNRFFSCAEQDGGVPHTSQVTCHSSHPVVSIPRPITRSEKPDGALRYRTVHTAALWKPGERPQLKTSVLEGDPGLAICYSIVLKTIADELLSDGAEDIKLTAATRLYSLFSSVSRLDEDSDRTGFHVT